jgi:hypothetical protein
MLGEAPASAFDHEVEDSLVGAGWERSRDERDIGFRGHDPTGRISDGDGHLSPGMFVVVVVALSAHGKTSRKKRAGSLGVP